MSSAHILYYHLKRRDDMREHCTDGWHVSVLEEEKDRCIRLAEHLIENQSTVRATAKHFGISKSTVHKDLSEKLPHANKALYKEVKAIMDQNKAERHLRGGQATKIKYRTIRNKNRRKRNEELF